ncbi:vitelline membrane outer layer protein 1 homolog, partial [Passer montanus]|uniref:vitelline membrane outer layer protein 1 homolog n=1 Tax=Passer montanus TaxID=9160 RepID=UPI001960FC23
QPNHAHPDVPPRPPPSRPTLGGSGGAPPPRRPLTPPCPRPRSRGAWSRPESCPPGQRLVSFRLRVEEPRGLWDDTAANAMAAICSGGSILEGRGGPQGAWGNWSVPCPPGAGVCGLR